MTVSIMIFQGNGFQGLFNMDKKIYKSVEIQEEPWVALGNKKDYAGWAQDLEVASNQIIRQTQKKEFYANIFDYLKENNIRGDYHEFGCHRARTFRMALTEARRQNITDMDFFAFDSFSGLPSTNTDPSSLNWAPGALKTGEEEFLSLIKSHGLFLDKVHTVSGFYSETLINDKKIRKVKDSKIAFLCLDCDLYESAQQALAFSENKIQEGTAVYIDDYFTGYKGNPNKGVAKAFTEYCKVSDFSFAEHMSIGWWGKSFIAYK